MEHRMYAFLIAQLVLFLFTVAFFYKCEIKQYFRVLKYRRAAARMRKYIDIYDEAVSLFEAGDTEQGELRMAEYAKKTGVSMAVTHYGLCEDGHLHLGETDIFHPDDYCKGPK